MVKKGGRVRLREDIIEFSQTIEPKILEFLQEGPTTILSLQYPAHGNPFAAGLNARLNLRGITGYVYRDFFLNGDIKGFGREDVENRITLVIDQIYSQGVFPYLRKLKDEFKAHSVYYAFSYPRFGIYRLEDLEKI